MLIHAFITIFMLTNVFLQFDDIRVREVSMIISTSMCKPSQLTPTIFDYVIMAMAVMC